MNLFRKSVTAAALAFAAVAVTAIVPASADTDTTPPTVPQNVHQSLALTANPVISWDASSDVGTGVKHYWVLVDGQQHAKPTATHYDMQTMVNLGLVTSGPHVITIQAVDFALNRSAPSAGINIVLVA